MYSYFLIQLTRRIIKILLSYISWQSNEMFLNPILSIALYISLFVLILSSLL